MSSLFHEDTIDVNNYSEHLMSKKLRREELITVNINKDFEFKGFIDLGNSESCMLVENINTRQIRFFKPFVSKSGKIEFEQLGLR